MSNQKRRSKKAGDGSGPLSEAPPSMGAEAFVAALTAGDATDAPPSVSQEATDAPPAVASPSIAPAPRRRRSTIPPAPGQEPAPRKRRSTTPPPPAVAEVAPTPLFAPDTLEATDKSAIEVSTAPRAAAKAPARKRATKDAPPVVPVADVPVVDHEHESEFFDAAREARDSVRPSHHDGLDDVDPKHQHKMSPEAHARRAELAKYVKIVVGVLAVLLVVAIVRSRFGGTENKVDIPAPVATATAVSPPPEVKAPEVVSPAPVASDGPALVVDAASTAEIVDASPEAAVEAAKDSAAPVNVVGVTGDGTTKPKTAGQEKATSRAALEAGNYGAAIASGERSVALDPADGEAWQLLGGAYQAKGNMGQARRCYDACIHQGKRGPIAECADLLKQVAQ